MSAAVHPVIGELPARGPVVTAGAWDTRLRAPGLRPGERPDSRSLTGTFRSNAAAPVSH